MKFGPFRLPFGTPGRPAEGAVKEGSTDLSPFVGLWRLMETDGPYETARGVEVEFHPGGQLTYTIHQAEKQQLILLTWRLEGGFVVTDQPSQPAEQRSKFEFRGPNELVLELEGSTTRLIRVGAGAS
jgi:hypothetical protein